MTRRVFIGAGLLLAGVVLGLGMGWWLGSTHGASRSKPEDRWVEFSLAGTIDGSDRFVFTPETVTLEHGRWAPPTAVRFNGLPWPDLNQSPEGWAELGPTLDLPRARIVAREGRDFISLEPTENGFALYFADTMMGAGKYSVTVAVPAK